MKMRNKLLAALCLALIACLAVPAVLPGSLGVVTSAQAASKKVKLNKTKATLYAGKTLKLKVKGTKAKVIWTSSDPSVATVSKKGVVKGLKTGTAKITAEVGKKTLACQVTVKSALTASATSLTLKKGEKGKIKLTFKLTGKISFHNDNAVATNCKLGKLKKGKCTLTVEALAEGTSTITVTNSKTSDKITIKVTVKGSGGGTDPQPPKPIVDKTEVTVAKGKSVKVTVTWPYDKVNPYYECYEDELSVKWGEWNGSGWPLTITGLKKGKFQLPLYKGKGGAKVATITVTVK